jgi:hypothetical protein
MQKLLIHLKKPKNGTNVLKATFPAVKLGSDSGFFPFTYQGIYLVSPKDNKCPNRTPFFQIHPSAH